MDEQHQQGGAVAIDSYSTTVQLILHVHDKQYDLADVGPFDARLRKPQVLLERSDRAILEIIVDGRSERKPVKVSASDERHRIRFLS
ncbi:MAG TPA: hypothetical protein VH253_04195 [Phycisphaerae bacterium]|nr:hypothetical protein [Phycisphaerae bacterium]